MLRMVCNGVETEPVLQEPTPLPILGSILWQGGSGRDRGRLSLMLEFATQMLTPTGIWILTRFTGNMKQKRSASTLAEF